MKPGAVSGLTLRLRRFASRYVEQIAGALFAVILLLLWESVCRLGLVDKLILPPPSAILVTLVRGLLGIGQLSFPIAKHMLSSLAMLAIAFPAGVVLGVVVGVAIGLNEWAYRLLSPVLGALLPVPAIAWTPIALVWFGLGARPIIAIVIYACFAEVVYNTAAGVRGVPVRFDWVIRSLGGKLISRVFRVILPASFPQIFVGIKLGLAASWRSLIGAEMFAGVSFGLGFMLYEAREFYATDIMFASLALVAIFSLLLEQVGLRYVERLTLARWGMSQTLEV
jgi:ABC-type nitrate/sulfonate/bicarbonate transport system permease component